MQLDLEAHRQSIGENPIRECSGGEFSVARRKEHRAWHLQLIGQRPRCPLVIGAISNDDFQCISVRQKGQVLPTIAIELTGPWRLDVHDATDTIIHVLYIERATGFETDVVSGIAQRRKK